MRAPRDDRDAGAERKEERPDQRPAPSLRRDAEAGHGLVAAEGTRARDQARDDREPHRTGDDCLAAQGGAQSALDEQSRGQEGGDEHDVLEAREGRESRAEQECGLCPPRRLAQRPHRESDRGEPEQVAERVRRQEGREEEAGRDRRSRRTCERADLGEPDPACDREDGDGGQRHQHGVERLRREDRLRRARASPRSG